MKVLRLFILFISLLMVLLLQACGGGSVTSDTAGSLTMSTPTSIDNTDGTYSETTTVTYTPPAGKSAQGVVINVTATDSFGVVFTDTATLTSGSNAVVYTFTFMQHAGVSNHVSFVANIGGMSASVGVVIPALAPLTASLTPVVFLSGDVVAPGKDLLTTISGGIGPYILISPSSVNGVLSVMLVDKILTIHNSTSTSPPVQAAAIVTVRDALNNTLNIPVTYWQ